MTGKIRLDSLEVTKAAYCESLMTMPPMSPGRRNHEDAEAYLKPLVDF